jgi:hypothetical protein
VIFLVVQIRAEGTVFAAFQVIAEPAVGTVLAVKNIFAVITFFNVETFIAKFAVINVA